MSTTGERVKQKREERGWSQSELARRMVKAGRTKHVQITISRTEMDARPIPLDEAVELAQILGVSMNWLASGTDDLETITYSRGHANGYCDGLNAARKAVEGLFS